MFKAFLITVRFIVIFLSFFLTISTSFGQTKAKETFVFDHPDFLKKQKGMRLSDSAEFILFNNKERGYTELYQKGQVYWFVEKEQNMFIIDRTKGDTVGIENRDVMTLEKNAKYQWVLGDDGEDHGYFFRKGEIVLSVETVNRKRKCFVKIAYNPRDVNAEFISKVALYKAHKYLNLNHNQEIVKQEELPYE